MDWTQLNEIFDKKGLQNSSRLLVNFDEIPKKKKKSKIHWPLNLICLFFSLNQSQSQGGVNTDTNLHQKVIKQTDLIELGQLT